MKQGCFDRKNLQGRLSSTAAWMRRLFFFLHLLILPNLSFGATIEYVQPVEIRQALDEANGAYRPLPKWIWQHSQWSCQLLGMQTHLQKQNFDNYLAFSEASGSARGGPTNIANSGEHFIKTFRLENGRLAGETEEVIEHIQLASIDQTLISVVRNKSDPSKILAVGHCVQNPNATFPK